MIRPDQIEPLYQQGLIREDQKDALLKRLKPELVESVIRAESSGNPEAVSPKGATGLMQVMPATGAEVAQKLGMENFDLKNPEDNRRIGEAYLSQMQEQFGDDKLALTAYNWGPGNLKRAMESTGLASFDELAQATDANGNPLLPQETRDYVPKVLQGQGVSETAASKPQQPAGQGESPQSPFDIQKEAIEKATAAGVIKATEEAALRETLVQKQDEFTTQQLERENERREQLELYENNVKTALDELKTTEVDPDRWWKNQGTGGKIVAAISLALGAFGSSLTKTRNTAFDIIQSAINNDIAAQRINLAGKRDAVAEARGVVAQMRGRFQDERVADRLALAASYENAQAKLEKLQATYQGQKAMADGQMLYGQLEAAKQTAMSQAMKAQEEMIRKNQELQLKVNEDDREERKLQTESPQGKETLRQAVIEGKANVNTLPKEDRERFIPNYGFAQTKDEALKFKSALRDEQTARALIGQLKEIVENNDGQLGVVNNPFAWSTKARIENIRGQLVGALRVPLTGGGNSSDKDMERVEKLIADPRALMSSDSSNMTRLNQLERDLSQKMKEWEATVGLKPPPEIKDR